MYLIFDTETTGKPKNYNAPLTDPNWPRIVQLAWIQYNAVGQEIDRQDYIIKPEGFPIPNEAVEIHGISTERAKKEGEDLKTVLNEFSKAIDESDILVAHNINFDEKIVGAEFVRKKIQNNLFKKSRICTLKGSTDFCKLPGKYDDYKWPSLPELYFKLFNKKFEETHNAVADVLACAECFFELKKRGIIQL